MRACVPSQKRWMSRSEIAWGPCRAGPAGLALSAAALFAAALFAAALGASSAIPPRLPPLISAPCSRFGVSPRLESSVLLAGTSVIRVLTCHGTLESGSCADLAHLQADWSAEVRGNARLSR